MTRGFTLIEVVMALLVLQVAMIGVLGTLVVAARTMRRAEHVERATERAESTLDSLRGGAREGRDSSDFRGGTVRWTVGADGTLALTASGPDGIVVEIAATVPVR